MERPIFQPVGTPVEELDTPALVIDLDVMDRDSTKMRDGGPFVFAQVKNNVGLDEIIAHIEAALPEGVVPVA